MDVFEAIKTRRSIRKYKPDPIPDDILMRILESARLAPSASGRQPWTLVVIRNKNLKKALASACNNTKYVEECNVFIVGVGDPSQKWYVTDLSVAMEHMVLTAWDSGVGSCWIGYFTEDLIKAILDIPEDRKIVACLTLGYPDERPEERPRKDLKDLVYFEKFMEEGRRDFF
ncbi:nitroreductase [Methanocella sp. CWC-04]|uniref:Nitroreductase n=1 Tax=Methanooceanicella nereidis TaxID=2052831 RepID=A0AAP2RA75_9EURY|nr:nitroreductase family protein [Methanocella sp. CWC-04]MCD1293764.1 nitroreductase [Methanocella sp. CWC-04]